MNKNGSPPPVVFAFPPDAMTPEELLTYAIATHRAMMILDDWICDNFNLSRKARGKKAQRYLSADKQALDKAD
jgi:hypothetical protein